MVGKKYVASRNVKRLQEAFDSTPNPGFRLRRDLADAQAYLITAKAADKAGQRAKKISKAEAQVVEAENEAHGALTAKIEAERASKNAEKAAKVAMKHLTSLRKEGASDSALDIAESREKENRVAFHTADDVYVAAEKQLYEADKRVLTLQRRLTHLTGSPASNGPTSIADKQALVNGSERSRVSPLHNEPPPPPLVVSPVAAEVAIGRDASEANSNQDNDDHSFEDYGPFSDDDADDLPLPQRH